MFEVINIIFIFTRMLQIKLDQPVSDPASPNDINNGDTAANLSTHIQNLRSEVARLRAQLAHAQQERMLKLLQQIHSIYLFF